MKPAPWSSREVGCTNMIYMSLLIIINQQPEEGTSAPLSERTPCDHMVHNVVVYAQVWARATEDKIREASQEASCSPCQAAGCSVSAPVSHVAAQRRIKRTMRLLTVSTLLLFFFSSGTVTRSLPVSLSSADVMHLIGCGSIAKLLQRVFYCPRSGAGAQSRRWKGGVQVLVTGKVTFL